ncbi:MAG: hypothetical protein AMK73_00615 [Planctomycetes bacterium SM23_32]|nr:MAG: hypothetical protein AMK73_00615 [Planctomycetes bacterium SM23_32]
MLIGVMSDTHDNLPKIAAALQLFAGRGVAVILHAGDYVAPFALKLLLKTGIPLVGVLGNNDGERAGLKALCATLYDPPHRLHLGGRLVLLTHDPAGLPSQPEADLIVHGHTHSACIERGEPLVVNPGEAGGWLTGTCTVGVVDLDTMQAEIADLGPQETTPI